MKFTKNFIALMLVFACVFAMSIPAAAADTEWLQEFRNEFPMLSQGSGKTGYISALQCFLSVHTSSASAMDAAGGIDGAYGTGTANAVKKFQTYAAQYILAGTDVDGIAGGDTWFAVAHQLNDDNQNGYLTYGSNIVMQAANDRLYYKNNGYIYFHDIVGNIVY